MMNVTSEANGFLEENIPLDQHGWPGCLIPKNLRDFLDHLPTWKNLVILRPAEVFGSRKLRFAWEQLVDLSGRPFIPALQIVRKLAEGTYGEVFQAQRALYTPLPESQTRYHRIRDFFEIVTKCVKVTLTEQEKDASKEEQEAIFAEEIQAILYEAALHVLVYHTMRRAGFPTVIPELFDVMGVADVQKPTAALQIQAVFTQMEFVAGETLHNHFKTHLMPSAYNEILHVNDALLLDVLVQLCVYLDILQTRLRFNHRDLKVNNVLRRKRPLGWTRELQHPLLPQPWICRNDLVLIDFGFSCVACDEPQRGSMIQAGSWFKMEHDCMKEGRDMALFLYCLQSCFPLKHRITQELLSLLEDAVTAVWTSGTQEERVCLLRTGIDAQGHPVQSVSTVQHPIEFNEGIYKFLRRYHVEVPGCSPKTLLATLQAFAASRNIRQN